MKRIAIFLGIFASIAAIVFLTMPKRVVRAAGTTYYVAKTGSDSNTCVQAQSQSTPKLTINAGAACLSGGDTLVIMAGTYDEQIANLEVGTNIPSGSAGNPTVFTNYGNDVVWVSPTMVPMGFGHVLEVSNRSYVTFNGIRVDAAGTAPCCYPDDDPTSANLKIEDDSNHIIYTNGEMINCAICVNITEDDLDTGVFNEITNSSFHEICLGLSPSSGNGMAFYISVPHTLIDHNTIYNSCGAGLYLYHQGFSTEVHDNILSNNIVHNVATTVMGIPGDSEAGFWMGFGSNNLAYNNVIYNNGADAILVADACVNCLVYNNTVYNNGSIGIEINGTGTTAGAVVKNNISYANAVTSIFDNSYDNTFSNNLCSSSVSAEC